MFTGIIEELGKVKQIRRRGGGMDLTVSASMILSSDLKIGDSVAVSGACLTVTVMGEGNFSVEVSGETLAKTHLGSLRAGDPVNLERPIRLSGRLGGHLVTGHVDEVGFIQGKTPAGETHQMTVKTSPGLHRYLVNKGSIAVDGVSLTVNEVTPDGFQTVIIPHTAAVTTLGLKRDGDPVNLEADLIGKYVERLMGKDRSEGKIDREFLEDHGFYDK